MAQQVAHSRQPGWDEAGWDAFVAGHPAAHPLQLHTWGQLKAEYGWEDARLALVEGGRPVAGAQVLFRPLPRLGFLPLRVAYVPKGPLVDWTDAGLARELITALWQFSLRRGASR